MMRTLLIIVAILASTASAAGNRKPVLNIYGDRSFRNCEAFQKAWETRPEFREAITARYDVFFPQTPGPAGYRCYPTFHVVGTEPLCGFRGVDVLLGELGIAPPAKPRPDATLDEGRLNEVKASIHSTATTVSEHRDALEQLRKEQKAAAEKLDALQIESTAFRDRTETGWQRFDELREALARESQVKAALDRRIAELERRPALVPSAHPPFPLDPRSPGPGTRDAAGSGPDHTSPSGPGERGSKKREWIWTLFGIALPAAKAAGILATGGAGGIALTVLPLIIRGIARRRAAKGRASDFPPSPSAEPRPPATRVIPDTQYTPIEVDRHAQAFAWAKDRFGRKYPASAEAIEALDGMIKLHLSGQHVQLGN